MKRLIDRDNLSFTPLPMGTANNVCCDLGIEDDPLDILRRIGSPQPYGLDVGQMQAPWGKDCFLERAGLGFFAEVLASYDPEEGKSVLHSLKSIVEIVQEEFSREIILELPDETIQDEFLLVGRLNTTAVGPRHLNFAIREAVQAKFGGVVAKQAIDSEIIGYFRQKNTSSTIHFHQQTRVDASISSW